MRLEQVVPVLHKRTGNISTTVLRALRENKTRYTYIIQQLKRYIVFGNDCERVLFRPKGFRMAQSRGIGCVSVSGSSI